MVRVYVICIKMGLWLTTDSIVVSEWLIVDFRLITNEVPRYLHYDYKTFSQNSLILQKVTTSEDTDKNINRFLAQSHAIFKNYA